MDWRFNKFERLVIFFAIVMIISLGVSGCATKTVLDSDPPTDVPSVKQPTRAETIGKMPAIVDALGCMFAPQTCGKNTDK